MNFEWGDGAGIMSMDGVNLEGCTEEPTFVAVVIVEIGADSVVRASASFGVEAGVGKGEDVPVGEIY